jgi:hypothetical protein
MTAMESGAQDSQQPGLTDWPEKMSATASFERLEHGSERSEVTKQGGITMSEFVYLYRGGSNLQHFG